MKVTMPKRTDLVVLEPTEVPRDILKTYQDKIVTPDFYGKMGDLYCVHSHDSLGKCGIGFFVMIDGEVCVPEGRQPKLDELGILLSLFIHERG